MTLAKMSEKEKVRIIEKAATYNELAEMNKESLADCEYYLNKVSAACSLLRALKLHVIKVEDNSFKNNCFSKIYPNYALLADKDYKKYLNN